MLETNWTGDFMADIFTDRLHPEEDFSFNDPLPTKCSFGRGMRQEEISIPRMPRIFFHQIRENAPSSIGRGIHRKSKSSCLKKPGMISSQYETEQKTEFVDYQQKTDYSDSPNLDIVMEPLFLHQNCPLSIPVLPVPIDHSVILKNSIAENESLDMKNEAEFPSLPTTTINESSITKQTETNEKPNIRKKKKRKKRS